MIVCCYVDIRLTSSSLMFKIKRALGRQMGLLDPGILMRSVLCIFYYKLFLCTSCNVTCAVGLNVTVMDNEVVVVLVVTLCRF